MPLLPSACGRPVHGFQTPRRLGNRLCRPDQSSPNLYWDHYPTDILVGALLGIGIAFLAKVSSLRNIASVALNYLGRRPAYLLLSSLHVDF